MIMEVAAYTAECTFSLLATFAGHGHVLEPSGASYVVQEESRCFKNVFKFSVYRRCCAFGWGQI